MYMYMYIKNFILMILDIKRVDDRVILHFTFTHKDSSTSSFNVIKYKYIQIQIHGISDMSLTAGRAYILYVTC